MNRRYISFVLVLVLLSGIFLSPSSYVYASEAEQYGYIEVFVNGSSKNYVALKNKNDLYLRAEDISEITSYDLDIDDIIGYRKTGKFDTTTAVSIESNGNAYAMGKEYKVNIIKEGEDIFLPLNEMLYLLHSQWCMENGCVVIQPLPYTIIDFLGNKHDVMWKNKVNQTDLLINGESELWHNLRSSLASVFNDFDPKIFVLWWPEEGISPSLNEEYEDALLQLTVNDKDFLDAYGQTKIIADLEQANLDSIKNDLESMSNILDISENIIDDTENMDEVVSWLSELSNQNKSIKFNSYSDTSYMTPSRIKDWSQEIGNVTDALEIADLLINLSEVSQRSQNWSEEFIDQISILTDFDDIEYNYNKLVTNRVKNVASSLIEEYKKPIEAAADEAALQATSIILSKVFDESVFGKYFAIFNTGLAISKIDENIKNSIDAADLAYMVDCLVKMEDIAMNEMERSYSKLLNNIMTGDLTEQDIERLRNCAMLSLRTNLRNHAFVYYLQEKLNDDSNWTNSTQAQEVRNQILNDYVLLCQVMETEPYDKLILLNDFEHMYSDAYGMVRQPVTIEAFHEGEPSEEEENNIFELLPKEFAFSSGVGAWGTYMELNSDGTFTGQYHDTEMGVTGDTYPNGTVYISNFDGKFSIPKQVDEYTYSMKLEYLNTEGIPGNEYYENDTRYIYAEPYGLQNADEFLIYFPGIQIVDLPDGFVSWLYGFLDIQTTEMLPCYGIYNIGGEAGFTANSLDLSMESNSVTTEETETTLKNALLDYVGSDQLLYFYYDDFDGDGTCEAFGVFGEDGDNDELYNHVNVYFASNDGTVRCVNENTELHGYLTIDGLLTVNNHKFLLWERSAGGSGSATFIYGVKDKEAYEPEISGEYMCFGTSLESMGIADSIQPENSYVGFSSDFSKGYHDYVPTYFIFDETSGEFVVAE